MCIRDRFDSVAIDVSSDFSRFPRYGYSVDFDAGETLQESTALIEELVRDYHINVVQYYDWMWRHEKVVPSGAADSWIDMFGNTISKDSITQRINAGHLLNQSAMAYQMAYMAREDYEDYAVKKAVSYTHLDVYKRQRPALQRQHAAPLPHAGEP